MDANKFITGLITVVVPAYNAADTIVSAVNSILDQSYSKLEVYVVDDCSSDDTYNRLDSIKDDRLFRIKLGKNIGTDAIKNLVLSKYTKGEYFAHQDADDLSFPQRFEKQLAFLNENPDVAICGTAIDEFFLEEDSSLVMHEDLSLRNEFERGDDGFLHRKNIYPGVIGPDPDFSSYRIAMNGSLIFRSDVLSDYGGVDGRCTVAAADTEVLIRLIKFNKLVNLEDVLYGRRIHSLSVTASEDKGRKSDARKAYSDQIMQMHEEVSELIRNGEINKAKSRMTYDMYVPQVEIVQKNF